MIGTSHVVACAALIGVLQADATLTADGVSVRDDAPILPADLQATDGDYESIWLADANISYEIPILTAGHLHRDETIVQQLMIQVLKPTTAGTQTAARARAAELLARVHAILANNVDLGVTDPARFEAVLTSARWVPGYLGNGQGHGGRYECNIEFTARLTPT